MLCKGRSIARGIEEELNRRAKKESERAL